jgi:membrane peptidoglycan carboxypeptidase
LFPDFFEYFLISSSDPITTRFDLSSVVKRVHIHIPSFRFISNKLSYIFLGSFLTLIALFIYQSYIFTKNLPSPYTIGKVNYPLSTHIYDRKGKLLYEVYREQNRTPVDLDKIPSYVPQATIAIEDKDFYRHKGISFVSGILRASKEILVNKNLQGGSTITQQLVKSALLSPERTIQRKIKEIILALWTEQIYNKKQILEMYLNQVAYGGSAYGIQEGARTYFGKDGIVEQKTLRSQKQLDDALTTIRLIADRIEGGDFAATPGIEKCSYCPYRDLCPARATT